MSTQVLRPGVHTKRCGWRMVWRDADSSGPAVLGDALATTPDATVLQAASVESSALYIGPAVRECVTIRGTAARRITEVVLPSVGDGHEHH